jgi:hypothetical protein
MVKPNSAQIELLNGSGAKLGDIKDLTSGACFVVEVLQQNAVDRLNQWAGEAECSVVVVPVIINRHHFQEKHPEFAADSIACKDLVASKQVSLFVFLLCRHC